MLKPGVLNRRLVGEVLSRLEKKGLRIAAMKLMQITPELAARHYAEHKGKSFYDELVSYITSAPVVTMVLQGNDCVALVRKLAGATNPLEAQPGTIRGDYCSHMQHNIIHASDSDEAAAREIGLFFKPEEIFDWADDSARWY